MNKEKILELISDIETKVAELRAEAEKEETGEGESEGGE